MNDRTKRSESANRRRQSSAKGGTKKSAIVPVRAWIALGVLITGFTVLQFFGGFFQGSHELMNFVQVLFEKSLSALPTNSELPEQVKKISLWQPFESSKKLTIANGVIAVLSASEYAEILDSSDKKYSKYEVLYVSNSTGRFVVYFESSRNLAPSIKSSPNYYVTLQSLNPQSSERDPRELIQWFHDDWSQASGHRFPLSLDQKYPALQFERIDETRFWMRGMPVLKTMPLINATAGECFNHGPMTTRTAWTQSWFANMRKDATEGFSGAKNIELDSSKDSNELKKDAGFVLLHDSVPDREHEELAGQIHFTRDFGIDSRDSLLEAGVHGTHVAGLLAAARNRIGVAGVAPGAQIVVEPFPSGVGHLDGNVTLREVIPSLARVKKFLDLRTEGKVPASQKRNPQGIRAGPSSAQIVLLSYASEVEKIDDGLPFQVVLEDIIREHDVLIIVPAGNRSMPSQAAVSRFVPAELAYGLNRESFKGVVLPIGASDVCSRPAWFSNPMLQTQKKEQALVTNSGVQTEAESLLLRQLNDFDSVQRKRQTRQRIFYAPGQSLYSTFPSNDYGFLSGTSAAAALTAGIAFAIAESQQGYTAKRLDRILEKYSRPMKSGSDDFMIDSAVIVEKLSTDERYSDARADVKRSSTNLIQK